MAALLLQLVLTCLQLGSAPGLLPGYRERSTETGRLFFRGWADRDVDEVAERLPRILEDVEHKLGRRLQASFTTVLAPGASELERIVRKATGSDPAGSVPLGVAMPGLRLLVLRDGLIPGTGSFRVTLAHEVAHLVIHGDPGTKIPKWLDEGAAMWLSGFSLTARDEGYLGFLARIGALYPLRRLEYSFPPGERTTSTAYRQSYLLVTYLVERHGEGVVGEFLDRLERGEEDLAVLADIEGAPIDEVERRFGRWVQGRQSLLVVLASVVNLWTIIAGLALIAIVVQIRWRRRQWKALEASEEGPSEPVSPEPEIT